MLAILVMLLQPIANDLELLEPKRQPVTIGTILTRRRR
jgi:hypothetical protein